MKSLLRSFLIWVLALSAMGSFAQAPTISYSTPQTYTAGVSITPLSPTSSNVGAAGSFKTTAFVSGFTDVTGVAVDASGNVYVADDGANAVEKMTPIGGAPVAVGSGFVRPTGVAVDAAGNVYVVDSGNHLVKKVPVGGGAIVTLGTGFVGPYGIAVDGAGNIYVGDATGNAVKKILAGTNTTVTIGTGFSNPAGVAVDAAGNVYVADKGHGLIKKILASDGSTVTLSTGGANPLGVAVDSDGNVYFSNNTAITKISAAGGGNVNIAVGSVTNPRALALDGPNIFVANNIGTNIIKIVPTGGYSISPVLPAGLSFNRTTGTINGTPTVLSPAANYTVTAYNTSGSSTATVNITVAAPAVPNITYSTPQVYTQLTPITPLSPTNSGGNVYPSNGYAISPALPVGLSIDANTGVISGTPKGVSAAANYTVTASNYGGDGTTNINITVSSYPAPVIEYTSPQTYTVGTAITPLSPANSGGAVPPNNRITLGSGFNYPFGVGVDGSGNVYFAEYNTSLVKMIPAGGGAAVTFGAGSGFSNPKGVAVDAAGNVYVVDYGHNSVRKIPAGGGIAVSVASGFNQPLGVAVDAAGNVYVGDAGNNVVKKIPAGTHTPVVIGSGFSYPAGVAVDAAGNVYVSDNNNSAIKEILASDGSTITLSSGARSLGVAVDPAGNVYFTGNSNGVITEILAAGGGAKTIAPGFINGAQGIAVDASGVLYVTDNSTHGGFVKEIIQSGYTINPALPAGLSIDPNSGVISGTPVSAHTAADYTVTASNYGGNGTANVNITVSPIPPPVISYATPQNYPLGTAITPLTPTSSGVAAPGTTNITLGSNFIQPNAVTFDAAGNTYVSQGGINSVQKIPAAGGTPVTWATGLTAPTELASDAAGNVYFNDAGNGLIKKIPAGGGTPVTVASGFEDPHPVAIDAVGNVFVSDFSNGFISKILAGTSTKVVINSANIGANAIASDPSGNLYCLQNGIGHTLREILASNNSVVTIDSGAVYNNATGIAVDAQDNVYVVGGSNTHVTEVLAGGGQITIGPVFSQPQRIAVDSAGAVYVTDSGNGTVTKIIPTGGYTIAPVLPAGLSFDTSSGVISGTPTAPSPATNYLVKAYNSGGYDSATLNITVSGTGLSNLTASTGSLSPAFATNKSFYTINEVNSVSSITLTPTTSDASYTVAVNGTPVTSGTASPALALSVGANQENVVVKSSGGTVIGKYTVTVNRAAPPSTEAHLSALELSHGNITPALTITTTAFTASEPYATSSITVTPTSANAFATIKINGSVVVSGSASGALPLAVGTNNIAVVVTAQDGVTTRTYTITVTRAAASTNAGLGNLTVNRGTLDPAFATGTTSYTDAVSATATSINIRPTVADVTATVTVNGVAVASGAASAPIALNLGPNTITTVVTAQDGVTTKTYTITVGRGSQNTNLTSLNLSSGALTPSFVSGTINYTASVSAATTAITVTPTNSDANATVTVNGTPVASGTASAAIALALGPNTITTVVTAQDGVSTKTYTVIVGRGSNNANLNSMHPSGGALSPSFSPGTTSYTDNVSNATASITLTPVTTESHASIKVNGTPVTSGSPSGSIALVVGPNTINTVVTAQDGVTKKTYSLVVTRAPSVNANLSNLALSAGSLAPAFTSGHINYTASVANSVVAVTVTPTTAEGHATITVNGNTVASGSPSASLPLTPGPNTITTVVTAQDGTTTKTYTVTVTRIASSNANLTSMHPSVGGLTPSFTQGNVNYTESVANTVASITITPTTAEAHATVKVNGTTVASGTASAAITLTAGSNLINTVVTAQDGTTTKTYTLTVTKAAGMANPPGDAVVSFAALPEDDIIVHQGLSPNGDGDNDALTIEGITSYPDNKLMIMSRSGVLLYEAKGYDNTTRVFDGHSNKNGKLQQPGTYFYSLEYKADGVTKRKTGFIVLKY